MAYILKGPHSGRVGKPSASFEVVLGTLVASDTLTLSDGGGGGTFKPTGAPIANSSKSVFFKYTPGSLGPKTITVTSTKTTVTGSPWAFLSAATSRAKAKKSIPFGRSR